MNLSEIFIRRPIATSLLMGAIALFGLLAYRALPVSAYPNVDLPTIAVTASLPGASPETMASSVATPLERQFSTISGLDSMTSNNALGGTRITLQFDLNRNIDAAAQDVQAAITQAGPYLPPGMTNPPTFAKTNPNDEPVLRLALISRTLPLNAIDEYGETLIAPRMSMVNGVAQVQVAGAQKYAVRIQLDPLSLAAKQIGIDEVETAIRNGNVNIPTGALYGPAQTFTVQATGQLLRADAYRSLVVAYRNGSPVHLGELGRILDSVEDNKAASWLNTAERVSRTIGLWVVRQPGTNIIEIRDAVMKLLPQVKAQLPPALEVANNYDGSVIIRQSFRDIKVMVGFTLALVVMVIFLFLRNGSATAIPSLALPFSLIGTFAVMYLLGYSLNNLSLMALILSLGFVVDDAIVMLENIVRHMELGEGPWEAALNGAKEIGFTIVSMTLSLAAVFIPVVFMGGILGRLLKEFGMTICAAILISGVVSVTLTPMLCSRFLRPPDELRRGRFYRVTERFLDGLRNAYERSLQGVLRYRLTTIFISLLIVAATAYLFVKIPKGFVPPEDRNSILAVTEAPQGTSYQEMVRYQDALSDIMRKDPNVESVSSNISTGATGLNLGGSNVARMFVNLKPRSERPLGVEQALAEMRPKVAELTGVRVILQNPASLRIGGNLTRSAYQFTLQGPDTAELFREAQKFATEIATLPALQDIASDLEIKDPQVNVQIDREKAAALNVSPQQIENALYDAYGPRWVSTIYAPDNQYKVLLELAPQYQADPNALSLLYLKSSEGRLLPLSTVVKMTRTVGPQTINHLGQLPAVTLSFNLRPGVALGNAVAQIEEAARRSIPATISTSFQGEARAFESSLNNLWILLVVAILVVYIVLGILYESYLHPLTILSGLPSAGFGALVTLLIFHIDLNIYAFVGLIMLIGIVKKNAIMQIDFALEAERRAGKSPLEAIYEGCVIRFRPIMMTTMAALLGALPIALGYGVGGEVRRPLGLTVVGGLLFSQLITLYLTPVFYTYMASFQEKIAHRKERKVLLPTPT